MVVQGHASIACSVAAARPGLAAAEPLFLNRAGGVTGEGGPSFSHLAVPGVVRSCRRGASVRLVWAWAAGGVALAVGVIVHMALLEFFRLASSKASRPATKTTCGFASCC